VSGGGGSATTGFKSGPAFGGVVGHNLYPHLSGEVRYGYLMSDLKLSSGGNQASFNGMAHVLHYDLLIHPNRRGSKVQPFVAAGGGMKLFRGTGKEAAYQPLNEFAYLTRTGEVKPMISVGAGAKVTVAPNVLVRVEFRDYITPFPKEVIAPAPGAKISGWLHHFVPLVGISFTF
jgi:hypothetical protein